MKMRKVILLTMVALLAGTAAWADFTPGSIVINNLTETLSVPTPTQPSLGTIFATPQTGLTIDVVNFGGTVGSGGTALTPGSRMVVLTGTNDQLVQTSLGLIRI